MKIFKWIAIILILIIGGFSITILNIGTLKSQIAEIAGLAVIQPSGAAAAPPRWNNVKDAAVGDNQTTGIVVTSPYLFDGTNYDPARGTATYGMYVDITRTLNLPVYTTVSATFTTNQIAVDATAGGTLIRAINLNRRSIIIKNHVGSDVYVGVNGVLITTGILIKAGEALTLDRTTAAIYGITAALGAATVGYLEE